MTKRILILGAGNAQKDAIEYCKSNGMVVIGCSYTTDDAAIPLLDIFEQVDIKDIDGIIKIAKKHSADVIYSIGSDLAMPSIMKASEALNLPHFISSHTAEVCHAKHLMRETLGNNFSGNAPFIVCDNLEDALKYNNYPGMMKPVDSQGQRGCFRVDSEEDIRENFAASLNYSVEGKVIIEKFIDGTEISVNAYLQDGKLRCAVISDRIAFEEYPGGIIKEHVVPSRYAQGKIAEKVIDLVRRSAAKLGLCNGPCYYQIMLTAEGEPIILEVAPRFDGCHMWRLIKAACGVDMLDACFKHLLYNETVLTKPTVTPEVEYRLTFMSKETGEIFNRDEYNYQNAEYVCWYYNTGDVIKKINGYIEKGGYMICANGEGEQN